MGWDRQTDRHRETRTDRQTPEQTDIQSLRDNEIVRHRDKNTETKTETKTHWDRETGKEREKQRQNDRDRVRDTRRKCKQNHPATHCPVQCCGPWPSRCSRGFQGTLSTWRLLPRPCSRRGNRSGCLHQPLGTRYYFRRLRRHSAFLKQTRRRDCPLCLCVRCRLPRWPPLIGLLSWWPCFDLFGGTTLQIYRTGKNTVHVFGGQMFQIYRTDKVTDLSYRQKHCAPVWWLDVSDLSYRRGYRFVVQTKTMYTCTTLQIYRTERNRVHLHITDLSYRPK